MTIGEALQFAVRRLKSRDLESHREGTQQDEQTAIARFEAEELLQWVLGCSRVRLLTSLGDGLTSAELLRFKNAVDLRMQNVPLQHVTGVASFYGREFAVQPGCLIPRPETELLVEHAASWLKGHDNKGLVLDFGTGSGVIAATLALECPWSDVYAVDISPAAVEIARTNFSKLNAPVRLLQQDGFALLREVSARRVNGEQPQASTLLLSDGVRLLVSNPPYIPTSMLAGLDPEVRWHEPQIALDGGVDGLDYYRQFSQLGDGFFAPGPAAIYFEVGESQAQAIVRLFSAQHAEEWRGWDFTVHQDLRGVSRFVCGERTGC